MPKELASGAELRASLDYFLDGKTRSLSIIDAIQHGSLLAHQIAAFPSVAVERDAYAAVCANLGQVLMTLSLDDRLDSDTRESCRTAYARQMLAHGLPTPTE